MCTLGNGSGTLVIVSDYTITYIEEQNIFVVSSAISCCPICGKVLSYRDTCERVMLLEGRERRIYFIRRLKCQNCGKIHRELPDCLVPYKQYAAEVISGVLDGIVTPEDEDSVEYPSEVTMKRWRYWLKINQIRIENYLNSVGYHLLGFDDGLRKPSILLLEKFRSFNREWLETLLRFIYNSGGFLIHF